MTASTLHEIQATPVAELAQQPAEALHRLQLDAGDLLAAVRAVVEHIERAVDRKSADRAGKLRLAAGKDTGVVHFDDGTVRVTPDPGRPERNAPICAFSKEQLAHLLNGPGHRVQQYARSTVDATSAPSAELCLPAVEFETPLYVPTTPLTDSTLCDWIATALPGERLQYHQGLLLLDRSATTSPYPPKERQRIHAVAKRAWLACELGLVHLVSQRVDPFVFRYLAVRTRMTPKAADVRLQLRTPAH